MKGFEGIVVWLVANLKPGETAGKAEISIHIFHHRRKFFLTLRTMFRLLSLWFVTDSTCSTYRRMWISAPYSKMANCERNLTIGLPPHIYGIEMGRVQRRKLLHRLCGQTLSKSFC
jgi:hypothetical protein